MATTIRSLDAGTVVMLYEHAATEAWVTGSSVYFRKSASSSASYYSQ